MLRLDRIEPGDSPALTVAVLAGLHELGGDVGVVVAADAPDLPGLLLAKLFRALARAEVAVCPADGGGLVALGARLPAPGWLAAATVGLDTSDALRRLAAAAVTSTALAVGPGWHRLRGPDDVVWLDPGLEGWAATRALLAGG